MQLKMTPPENVGLSQQRLALIKPGIQRWIDREIIPGASMMIARRGQVAYFEQVGRMDLENDKAMTVDTIFRLYSMTKPIICTALMTYFEEGQFQLYTPVSEFIPALGEMTVLSWDSEGNMKSEPAKAPITIGDLMKHTAGFTYDFFEESPVNDLYREVALGFNTDRNLAQYVATLAELPLAFHPGTKWHYSVGIDVAAHVLELVADKPLRDVLQERIFKPLGMVDTDFCVPEAKLPRLAAMYGVGDLLLPTVTISKRFAKWQEGEWGRFEVDESYPVNKAATFARGGHGLFSTAADYMRFGLMLQNWGKLDDVRVLGRKTVELMHTNHLPPALLPFELGGVPVNGYGFGLGSRTLLEVGGAATPGSFGEFGWAGAASTYYWVDPVEEMVGLFMTQYQGLDAPNADFRVLAYQAVDD